jgi:hypothetical protein
MRRLTSIMSRADQIAENGLAAIDRKAEINQE